MLFSILLFLFGSCNGAENPVVETPSGTVVGTFDTSYDGTTFSSFVGISYARPPIGERRFAEPEPIEPWDGVLNATLRSECPQTGLTDQTTLSGDEDCLHINVYVPREVINPDDKLEVFVYIHSGAFLYNSGTNYAAPYFWMDKGVILVTFNYRLGIFGFLSTEDDVVPGNNGLKDQVLALQWVQQNIGTFGGNPDSVTVFGGSAGSISVSFHYLSELSKGLFHRGFSISALSLNPVALVEGNLEKAERLADSLGCPTEPTQDLIDCLKQVPYKDILGKMPLFFGYSYLPIIPFGPVVEKGGSRPFLSEHPYYKLSRGAVLDLPYIATNTLHEGILATNAFNGDFDYVDSHWDELAPFSLDFNYTLDESLWQNTSEAIRKYYFGDEPISSENYLALVQLYTDRHTLEDATTNMKLQANATKSPVYYAIFAYPGDNNPNQTVPHGAEVKYIFGFGKNYPYTANDIKMRDLYLDMLLSYATTNKPVFKGVEWEPTGANEVVYLNITGVEPEDFLLESREELAPRKFWESFHFAENENLFL